MKCTGERFLPEHPGDWTAEHQHRYAAVSALCAGKDVLDVASGEGYGSALLARTARSVIGVDISHEAVEHARKKYAAENLEYRQGSATDLQAAGLDANAFDIVVSFETIEHLHEQEAMLNELCRVLRPNGMLIISSPDKLEYSDIPGYTNEYHVRELYRNEFEDLLTSRFSHVKLYGQRLEYGSLIVAEEAAPFVSFAHSEQNASPAAHLSHATYHLALASNSPTPLLPHSIWKFPLDQSNLVLELSNRIISTDEHVQKQDKLLKEQIEAYIQLSGTLEQLNSVLVEKNNQIAILQDQCNWQANSIHALTNSSSWKLTRPLRRASTFARTLKQKLFSK